MNSISGKSFFFMFPVALSVTIFFIISCNEISDKTTSTSILVEDSLQYVGREACKSCHEKEFLLFEGSDHDKAMDIADSTTVLGDFNDITFRHVGVESRFFRKNGDFFVFTEGPEGKMAEYKVEYVFGVRPLQQYLVAFPGGRYQCLPLCWDARPKKEGGQRWFHIYGDEKIPHTDFLYWTRIMQNWNYMCAECHSTNLKKGFDPATDSYHTTWSEIDVSCEACHGPGSAHVSWAEEAARHSANQEPDNMGLAIRLKDPEKGTWVYKPSSNVAVRTVKRDGRRTLETCARCHARRSTIHEDYVFGQSFLDTHRPSLLEDNLYFPDGQIQDEVYVYASFLQSKMYHKGVICSDCHDPHSLKVYVQGNALCYRCHLPDVYGSKSHHFHKDNSTGALCVECHMPERSYMQVDPRRDHSMRSPRPDLSLRLSTPNACTKCHQSLTVPSNWSDQMASDYFYKWYGMKDRGTHYGETFWKARRGYPEALPELIRLASDTAIPDMVRSTAYQYLSGYQDPSIYSAITSGVADPDPLIRFGAFEGGENITEAQKTSLYRNLLRDSVRLIRTMAARNMPQNAVQQLNGAEKTLYGKVFEEYMETEMVNSDHPFSWMNIGNYYLDRGDFEEAEKAYRRAILIEPYLPVSYINLTDLYRRIKMDARGEETLKQALVYNPGSGDVHHSLGLLLIRNNRTDEGIEHLKQAAELSQQNTRYAYVYGVALFSTGAQTDAIIYLENARKTDPFDRDILFALVSYYGEMGQLEKAVAIAEELAEYYPADQTYREVVNQLRALQNQIP